MVIVIYTRFKAAITQNQTRLSLFSKIFWCYSAFVAFRYLFYSIRSDFKSLSDRFRFHLISVNMVYTNNYYMYHDKKNRIIYLNL